MEEISVSMSKKSSSITNYSHSRIQAVKKLLVLAWPDTIRMLVGYSALAVNAVTNLYFPWIMGNAVDRISISISNDNDNDSQSIKFIIETVAIVSIGTLASWIRTYCLGISTENMITKLRKQLYNSYLDKDMDFFNSSKNGEFLLVLEKDIMKCAELLTENLASGLRSLNSSVNGSLLLYWTSPKLCGVSLGLLPVAGAGAMMVLKYKKKLTEKMQEQEGEIISNSIEIFENISTVKLNGREEEEKVAFSDMLEARQRLARKRCAADGLSMSFFNFAVNLSLGSVLYVGGGLLSQGLLTAGSLSRFAIQCGFVGAGFSGLSTFMSNCRNSADAAVRVFDLIESCGQSTASLAVSTKEAITAVHSVTTDIIRNGEGLVVLENVSFKYSTRQNNEVGALNNLSLVFAPCSLTAVVGRSGSGKSTLLSIISGLYRVASGTVTLDGQSISSIPNKTLRQRIGVVEQKAGLISGTIESNIAYGKPDASKDEIIRAAKEAYAHDFIMEFPDGYATQVGKSGGLLSGGQQMRIALARALVKNPTVLLLDEVTAALDQTSGAEVLVALQRLRRERTIIMFTHSEMLMRISDRVCVLQEGKLVAEGTFQTLEQTSSEYIKHII